MGVVTLKNQVMLDDLKGINIKGRGTLHHGLWNDAA